VLRIALNRAVKRKLVAQNPAALADAPRVVRAEVQSLTPDQVRTFLAAIADHHLFALIVVAVSCGLREGELLRLQWPDLDLDREHLQPRDRAVAGRRRAGNERAAVGGAEGLNSRSEERPATS
jgi:integrase